MSAQQQESQGPFASSYLRLCQKQGKPLVANLDPEPGDWLLGPDGLRLYVDASAPKTADEVVVPSLERVIAMLRAEAPIVVLDLQQGDVGLTAFDDQSRPLANIVSRNAPEACMRALLFILAERKADEMSKGSIQLKPVSHG